MNIQDAFKQEPHYIQDSPFVQVIVQLLQRQTEQIQSQIEKISTLESTIKDLKGNFPPEKIFRNILILSPPLR